MSRRIKRRTTEGLNARIFVGSAVEYSTDATFKLFVANAVDGEIGVYIVTNSMTDDSEATLQSGIGALPTNANFFIAQKQGELVKKTPTLNENDLIRKNTTAFCVPVHQQVTVGYNGTTGDLVGVVPVINQYDTYEVVIAETLEGYQPLPMWTYEYTAKTGDTLADIVVGLVASINNAQSATNADSPAIVKALNTSAGTGVGGAANEASFLIESTENTTFSVFIRQDLEGALVTQNVDFKEGSGYPAHVENMEFEGQIFDGTTTIAAQFKDKWGEQANYRVATYGYDVVHLSYNKAVASKALPNTMDNQSGNIMMVSPAVAGTAPPYANAALSPNVELAAIFA